VNSTVPQLYTDVLDAWSVLYDQDPADSERQWINLGYWTGRETTYEAACDRLAAELMKLAGIDGLSRVLDVGCGTGTSTRYWSDRVFAAQGKRPRFLGLNITPQHIAIANQLTDAERYGERVAFALGDATHMPQVQDDSYTHVMALECAFHFNTREKFLREAYRVLEPGGVVAAGDITIRPGTPTYHKLKRFLPAPLIRPLFEIPSDYMAMPLDNQITAEELEQQLRDVGFRHVAVVNINHQTLQPFIAHYRAKMAAFRSDGPASWMPSWTKKHMAQFKRKMDFTAFSLKYSDYVLWRAVK